MKVSGGDITASCIPKDVFLLHRSRCTLRKITASCISKAVFRVNIGTDKESLEFGFRNRMDILFVSRSKVKDYM
jgi:hypothetical protein